MARQRLMTPPSEDFDDQEQPKGEIVSPDHWTAAPEPAKPRRSILDLAEDEPETPADRIGRMLEQFADDTRASVRVYKVATNTGKLTWCKNYTPAEFENGDLEMIRAEWGPGDYQIRLYAVDPTTGHFGIRAREHISLAAVPLGVTTNPTIVTPHAATSQLDAIVKTLAEGQARILEALSQRPDPTVQLGQTLSLLAQMKSVFGPPEQPAPKSSISEIVEAVRELRAVSEEISPKRDEPEPDSMTALVQQIIGLVQASTAQRAAQPTVVQNAPQMVPAVSLPASIEQVSSPVTQGPTVQNQSADEKSVIESLRAQLLELVAMADAGKPVEDGAEFLYQKLPDELIDLLAMPQWFDQLCLFEPSCRSTPEREKWLREVRDIALAWFIEDQQSDEQGGKPTDSTPIG